MSGRDFRDNRPNGRPDRLTRVSDVDPVPVPPALPDLDLPDGWTVRVPDADDVPALAALSTEVLHHLRGAGSVEEEAVAALVTGWGSWTRRQLVACDPSGAPQAWVSVHDRAAGRTMVDLTVRPALPEGDWSRCQAISRRERSTLSGDTSVSLPTPRFGQDGRCRGW